MIRNNCIIRPAVSADIPALAFLMNELGYATSTQDMRTRYAALAAHPDYATWVAVIDDQVIGMIGLIRQLYYEKNGIYIRIGALVINSHYRKKGIGKLLMQKAENWAVETGASQVLLNSGNREERKDAHAFYQRLGFEPKTTGFVKTINSISI
jgi:GNAT superfamily N-acetyltransferase